MRSICRGPFITCIGPLFGARRKVAALEKPKIPSPNAKKCTGVQHRSKQVTVSFQVRRRARAEEQRNIFLQKSISGPLQGGDSRRPISYLMSCTY